jgi:hypothetical protein
MNVCRIGDKEYNVLVTKITENFNILYSENTGRTMSVGARMVLDPLGTFFGHQVTFRCRKGYEDEFDRLFDYLSRPRYDGVKVDIVHGQNSLAYDAYVSQGERALKKIDEKTGKVSWDEFAVNFVPMEAQVTP